MIEMNDLPAHIGKIKKEDWQKLFDLLEEIRNRKIFGELKGTEKIGENTFTFPHWEPAMVVDKFHQLVYDLGIVVVFDWLKWQEGEHFLENKAQDFQLLDCITLCKLITAIVRADRFNEGFLISKFEDGTMLKIIEALKHQIDQTMYPD